MPTIAKRLTDGFARSAVVPKGAVNGAGSSRAVNGKEFNEPDRVIYWCKDAPGFGLKVTSSGHKAWVSLTRVNGKKVGRTLGKAVGSGAISADAARKLFLTINNEMANGVDRSADQRKEAKAEKIAGLTFEAALNEYLDGKRRGKDGLALKERTKLDYLQLIKEGRVAQTGKPFADGPLFAIAHMPMNKITAEHMRKIYNNTSAQRTKIYAMQVLRAVLNWHGIQIEGNPLSKSTAGKLRLAMPSTNGKPTPIPQKSISKWWQAATSISDNPPHEKSKEGADGLRFMLLTGARPGEVFGFSRGDLNIPGLRVQDVDLKNGIATFPDTKNRSDHLIYLSKQAAAILKIHCKDKIGMAKVFDLYDPGKTLEHINTIADTPGISAHKLRHTFTSVAEELVTGYALKKMINHIDVADVTGSHYVHKSESQLRAAWQTVADFIAKDEKVKIKREVKSKTVIAVI